MPLCTYACWGQNQKEVPLHGLTLQTMFNGALHWYHCKTWTYHNKHVKSRISMPNTYLLVFRDFSGFYSVMGQFKWSAWDAHCLHGKSLTLIGLVIIQNYDLLLVVDHRRCESMKYNLRVCSSTLHDGRGYTCITSDTMNETYKFSQKSKLTNFNQI